MLPATIAARGRAVARGYGELLMLNAAPGVSPLSAYRYSPYTVPSSAAAAAVAAAAAAQAATASAGSPAAVSSSSPTQTLSHLSLSKAAGQQPNSLAGILANQSAVSAAAVPTLQQIQHQQLVAALSANAATPVLSLAAAAPPTQQTHQQSQSQNVSGASQQTATVQARITMQPQQAVTAQQTPAATTQAAAQLQHIQQLQILGLDGRLIPAASIPTTQAAVTAAPSLAQFASTTQQLTVANGVPVSAAAALAAAASCKPRSATISASAVPTAVAQLTGGQAASQAAEVQSQITYSVNDLVNFPSLQPLEQAANYQVPVGL